MRNILTALILSVALFSATSTQAQTPELKSNADLAQNLVVSNISFAADLKQFGLMEMLEGKGPFTVFAPSDELYKLAPEFTGEQKINYLKNYLVAQNISEKELASLFKLNNNQIQLTTLSGNSISLTKQGNKILVNMGSGATTIVTAAPQASNNGVIMQLNKTN